MSDIENQIRHGWVDYYKAIGAGKADEAKRIFDRITNLSNAQRSRKTTVKVLRTVNL